MFWQADQKNREKNMGYFSGFVFDPTTMITNEYPPVRFLYVVLCNSHGFNFSTYSDKSFRQPWTYVGTIQQYTCWNDSLQDTYLLGRKINVCKWHLSTYWLAFVLLINHLIEDQSCQALGGVFYSANCSCNLEASNLFMQYEYIFSFSCKRVFFPEYLCERG